MDVGLVLGVIALGIVHGVLPDHGWPIAATYALERPRKWLNGTIAALVLGIGHLISSVVLVLAYFWFSTFAAFAEGPWLQPLAGVLLILLGVYTYVSGGHDHGHHHTHHDADHHDDHGHHDHDDHGHHADHDDGGHDDHHSDHGHHDHDGESDSGSDGIRDRLPFGGHGHLEQRHAEEGLATLGITALVLGFAHEEPVQILAICAGTQRCLELMLVYSVAVIGAILAPTLLLIAGYQNHRERIESYTPYLPTITAAVLVVVGLGFVFGMF